MKKTLLVSAIAFAAAAANAQYTGVNGQAGIYDGIVKFEGQVTDQTCVVETGTSAGQQGQTVTLDKVGYNKLNGAGKVAGGKNFFITLKQCNANSTTATEVRAEFKSSPNVDAANAYTLKNTDEVGQVGGSAKGVNLRLLEANGTPIRVGDAGYTAQYTNIAGKTDARLEYSVEYYATKALAVTDAGTVKSAVEYSIVYK